MVSGHSALLCLTLWLSASCVQPKGQSGDEYARLRQEMVEQQILRRGINDPEVIQAMLEVPRHRFVSEGMEAFAYRDGALAIGEGQTISQPYVVAFMTQSLDLNPKDRVLEIGTGSGYQAAVLGRIVARVYTVEWFPVLGESAKKRFEELGYGNIFCRIGDGRAGWAENAPYDAVMITCASEEIPVSIVGQLREGGRLIMPRGPRRGLQKLVLAVKEKGRMKTREILDVFFVPMLGEKEGEK